MKRALHPDALTDALDARIDARIDAVLAKPEYVNQRSVMAVVGLPSRDFLRLARTGAFPSMRERRLVLAHTKAVVDYIEQRIALREVKPGNDADAEALALAKVGARRVSR